MKKNILLLFLFSFLVSCGPHRMSCGARGICDSTLKSESDKDNS